MNVTIAVLISLVQLGLATLGVIQTLKPPKGKKAKRNHILAFVLFGVASSTLTGWQAYLVQSEIATKEVLRRSNQDSLASLMEEGRMLQKICSIEGSPAPSIEADNWGKKTEVYLATLGKSYVVRFNSPAGLPSVASSIQSQTHRNVWSWLHTRLARLAEFSLELSR